MSSATPTVQTYTFVAGCSPVRLNPNRPGHTVRGTLPVNGRGKYWRSFKEIFSN